uniref:(California timema) hypothetical protein n=1 Tax=Timema californicum TaxID=61474 RepID=A0A7R9J9T1_TIMCA|nr:unnamed protein product [Timema californicum]
MTRENWPKDFILEINPDLYLESILNLTKFGTSYSFGRLRQPVNKSEWITHGRPAVVNAYYSSIENSIQFPAGILQGHFFNSDRPRYMNYGAIGFVIGHEITHGFDDQGRQFDKNGNLVDWWQAVTMKKYLAKTRCVIEQYGNYTDEHTGLKAYRAYLAWVDRNHVEQTLPGLDYTPRQMFWISAAQTWCSKYRAEAMHQRIITGVHSPGRFRVQGPCSNLEEFSKDFNCPRGSAMNPEKKCKVCLTLFLLRATFFSSSPSANLDTPQSLSTLLASPGSPHDTPAPSEKIVRNKRRPRDGLSEQRR